MKTLAEAKDYVRTLLAMTDGDAEAVYRAIDRAQRGSKMGATRDQYEQDAETYALQRLALADLTGNASYRL